MKKLLALLLTFTAVTIAEATPGFNGAKRYHIVCQQFTEGCVVDGGAVQQATPLYYQTSANNNDATYWYFTEEQTGLFSIKNASTGQYVTYDGVREDAAQTGTTRRYISMTDELNERYSLWNIIQQSDGTYILRNAQQTDHLWDVRVDSYVVGTYSTTQNASSNQIFLFYDEQGNQVVERNQVSNYGYDVSSWMVATAEALEGWNVVTGGWFVNTGAGGSHYNGEASTVAPFVENWHSTDYGGLDNCILQQSITNIPAGQYTLEADVIAVWQGTSGWWSSNPEAPGENVSLFANSSKVNPSTANNTPEHYKLDFTVTATGRVDLGLRADNTNANWIAIDNLRLSYGGTEQELIDGEKDKIRKELTDYYTAEQIEALIAKAGDDFAALESIRKSVANLPSKDPLSKVAGAITIDGHAINYIASLDLYMCSLPIGLFGSDYAATINYQPVEGAGQLSVNNQVTAPASQYTFKTVTGGKLYTLSIKDANGNTVSKNLTFTGMPIVKIYGSFNNSYSEGNIIVQEPNLPAAELLKMKAKWRGGITNSSGKNKRNYHVKLQDADGNKLEKKFFGLRNDNSWILESCQVDMSRIRNRVLTDLWNDYSTPPYYISQEPKAKTGTRGEFVELVLNDEYRGIYCMTENLDRKQMKLMKYDETTGQIHGLLWKSKDWSYAVFMGHNSNSNYYPGTSPVDFNNNNESWDQYYVKYPDIEDVRPTDWEPLYKAVNFVCTATDGDFARNAEYYFDMPLLIDYYILMETILSTDNHGKNMFFGVYDRQKSSKITFSVWDMDATSGQRWSDDYYHSNLLRPDQDYAEFITNNEHGDYNLFKRLRDTNAGQFNEKVRLRYRDLRDNYLATESILERFRTYLQQFKTCGADQREYNRWNGNTDISRLNLDFDNEMEYLTDWFTRRMNYLDTQRFDIGSLPATAIGQSPYDQSAIKPVYNLNGQKVGTSDNLRQLPAGIYIIGGKKVVVE